MKLPALNAVLDKRQLALARARFKAWWEGEEFDLAATEAALDALAPEGEAPRANDAAPAPEAPDPALFETPRPQLPPRFDALARFWGPDRLGPGDDTTEALLPARIGVYDGGVLAIIGAGLAAPILNAAKSYPGRIAVFEWRDETRALCEQAIKYADLGERVSMAPVDLDTLRFIPDVYDGVWSIDDLTFAAHPVGVINQVARALKPGAAAMFETYVAEPNMPLAPAFATAFAETHLRAHSVLCDLFHDSGLRLEGDDDVTADHIMLAREGFKRLEASLAEAAGGGVSVLTLREIAWEAEAWRARIRLMTQKRLRRYLFTVRKPDGDAAAERDDSFEKVQALIDRTTKR